EQGQQGLGAGGGEVLGLAVQVDAAGAVDGQVRGADVVRQVEAADVHDAVGVVAADVVADHKVAHAGRLGRGGLGAAALVEPQGAFVDGGGAGVSVRGGAAQLQLTGADLDEAAPGDDARAAEDEPVGTGAAAVHA